MTTAAACGVAAAELAAVGRATGRLSPVPVGQVVIEDEFWAPRLETWRRVTVPDCFDKFEKDGAFTNFDRVRDGSVGEHGGPPWYDGLTYEMIRGCADLLATRRDPALEARIDGIVARVAAAAARDPDGYLNTYTQLKEPTHRWGMNGGNDNWQHEVYNAGAMVEAGVHYAQATGKTDLLKVAVRLVNHMCDVMGPPPRHNVIPGHSLAEEALVDLYRLFRDHPELKAQMPVPVDEARYLALTRFFIDARGHHEGRPDFGAYGQDHAPLAAQDALEGHAVRATLFAAGVTALAEVTGRDEYAAAARRFAASLMDRRSYVTGGAGAIAKTEAFAADYELPNNGYLETCAAVGAAFFCRDLNLLFGEARPVDELERALYNGALVGVSLAGDRYTYVNPLEFGRNHARWPWHGCPCCPPMFLKLMGALPGYVYATDADGLYVNLFVGSRAQIARPEGILTVTQVTRYPWDGAVRLTLTPARPATFDLHVRIPGWCQGPAGSDGLYTTDGRPTAGGFAVSVNGQPPTLVETVRGYACLRQEWQPGDVVEVAMDMPPRRLRAHPAVAADRGRVTLSRGPLVYAVESADNPAGVRSLYLPSTAALRAESRPDLLGGVTVLRSSAVARAQATDSDAGGVTETPVDLVAVPYFATLNRGPVDMAVWLPEKAELAQPATLAGRATPSASHCCPTDTVAGLNDGLTPKHSADESVPRHTWWDHRGTAEWVQYDFPTPETVGAVEVYWWDERAVGRHCRVPQSWRLLHRVGDAWQPVAGSPVYGTEIDRYNRVEFDPVESTGLRLEVQLQPEWSGGVLEWRVRRPRGR